MVCPDPSRGSPAGRLARCLLVCWSVFLLAGFSLAVSKTPDPDGRGTHKKFGLPECGFLTMFNKPCPSCGMTTSFAHFVRGQWIDAGRANIGGLLLALVCTVQVPWCLWSAWRGELWRVRQPDVWLMWIIGVLTVVTGGNWIVTLVTYNG